MKKHILLFLSIFSLVTFSGCDDRDEIRDDINALSARLDALQVEFDKLNSNINTFYNLTNGKIYFTSYTQNENGDYTLRLSDGTSWTVYGGMPEGELPVVTINDEKKWIFSYEGEEIDLGSALPIDGKDGSALVMSIDNEGYWCYQIGDGEKQRVPGAYNVADVSKIHPSIFEDVKVSTGSPDVLQFKLYDSDDYINVAVLGGMDMTFFEQNPTIKKGGNITLTAKLTDVDKVVISPTPLNVELDESGNLTITVPAGVDKGEYVIYFEIYNKDGYRLVKPLHVTVTA
ncbi:PL29 family lyase N-terminal domain-containing protein [Phocaeicola plebeius]|uniref:PL29 family lyase N-terminal domain-containing protein n=1 Tax=Phocaeicola plebeius TaxID=310297 RepID=UPI0026EE4D36|nr:PL29 family lyase N-terminal domain-containing protein [Phocaeicola plebeius]